MHVRRLIVAIVAIVVAQSLFAGSAQAAVYPGYAPPLTDPANIPWSSQDSGWLSVRGADTDAWDIANRAVTPTSATAQQIHDALRSGATAYVLVPGYNPAGNSLSRSDWEVPVADYLQTANNGRVVIMELDYWRTNLIYGWAFDDGQSKAQRLANKLKSAGAGQIIMYGHSLGADVLGRVSQDNANVNRAYGFGIPCFSSWAPKNKGYAAYQGFHKVNAGKFVVFSRTSDPASGDNCVLATLGNWSSTSSAVPGHSYPQLMYDNTYHRYVNTNGSCPCPSTTFMDALANFNAGSANESTSAGSTYDWNKTTVDYRSTRLVDDNQATRTGTFTTLTGGFNNAVRRAYANGATPSMTVTWRATLSPATKYEARAYVPSVTGTATVTYKVCHSAGCTTKLVNQSSYSNAWVSLGTFTFAGTTADYIYLNNVTSACCSQSIAVDAVEFVPKSQ